MSSLNNLESKRTYNSTLHSTLFCFSSGPKMSETFESVQMKSLQEDSKRSSKTSEEEAVNAKATGDDIK